MMSRPQNKAALLQQSELKFKKLTTLIDQLTPEQQQATFLFEDRDRNVRDVLIHLYEWHQLLIKWINANFYDHRPTPFLPKPYTWKTYGTMNVTFWQQHQTTPLVEAKGLVTKNHAAVMVEIDQFSNEELFTKQFFDWTGTTSLGSYCVSSTASHYDWAIKKIRKHQRTLKNM